MVCRAAAWCLILGVVVVGAAACGEDERPSIIVESGRISVINQTGSAWTNVDVWLNYHYRAQAPRLEPGQRLDLPIGGFVAGFGQQFDPKRAAPYGVEVSARGADGKPVILTWGKGPWR